MARERLSTSTSTSSSQNVPPTSLQSSASNSKAMSRLPVKAKRAPLGERVENLEHATPRQHLVKSGKSVIRPSVSASPRKQMTVNHARPAATTASPASSVASTPVAANISRPGSTPHPRRSSIGLDRLLQHADDTMLMDMRVPDDLVSESETSDAGEGSWPRVRGRGIVGAGRLLTPENSQENRHDEKIADNEILTNRPFHRLPTPPSSQPDRIELPSSKTLVRPRPEPTPPRLSASATARLRDSLAPLSQNASPNPRRRKSAKVGGQAETPRLRSPFDVDQTSTPASSSKTPRNRMEVVITQPRKSASRSPPAADVSDLTPQTAKASKKGRPSTRTPRLSQSTSTRQAKAKQPPATAPPADRRRSLSDVKSKKSTAPRASLPAFKKGRSSLSTSTRRTTPGATRQKMVGILPEPVEQGSPSDDPLLLVEDDESSWGTPSASGRRRGPSSTVKRAQSGSTARIIDFDALLGQKSVHPAPSADDHTAGYQDYQVPFQGSEPDFYDPPAWGNESDGGSDMDDIGNDTFAHVTGGAISQMLGTGAERSSRQASEGQGQAEGPAMSPARSAASPGLMAEEAVNDNDTTITYGNPTLPCSPQQLESTGPVFSPVRSSTPESELPALTAELSPLAAPPMQADRSPLDTASPAGSRSRTLSPAMFAAAEGFSSSPMASPVTQTYMSGTQSPGATSPTALPLPLEMRTASPLMGALGLFMHTEDDDSAIPAVTEAADVSFAALEEPPAATARSVTDDVSEEDGDLLDDTTHEMADTHVPLARSTTPLESPPSQTDIMCSPRVPKSPLPELSEELEEDAVEQEMSHATPPRGLSTDLGVSTTPAGTPPAPSARSPMAIRLPFSPRYASPLRAVQARSLSPEKPVEVNHHLPASPGDAAQSQEPDDPSPSADVTLEGNSQDWSLSDDEQEPAPGNENVVTIAGAAASPESAKAELADDIIEGESGDWALSKDDSQEQPVPTSSPDLSAEEEAHFNEESLSNGSTGDLHDESHVAHMEDDASDEGVEGDASEIESHSHQNESNPTASDAGDVTVEGDSADWSLSDQTAFEEDDAPVGMLDDADAEHSNSSEGMSDPDTPEEPHDSTRSPAVETGDGQDNVDATATPDTNRKIILRLINVGTVKVEPQEDSATQPTPPTTAHHLSNHSGHGDVDRQLQDAEVSTTPRYSPPRKLVLAHAASPSRSRPAPAPAPANGLSPSKQPTTPPAVLRRLSLANASAVPSLESMLQDRVSSGGRPPSRLSRQLVRHEDHEDEAEQSIRVRSRPSLDDELLEADESMRSVVEVSSLDPKAAARAAAILKMNHAYIEHGDLTKIDRSQRQASPRRRKSTSCHPGKIDKTELLHEAELEIVSTRRSRSRSMSRFRGVSEALTDIHLPGAWIGTPKRKRHEIVHEEVELPKPTKAWGVSQWKKLEKVFRAERELWTKEREVKSMPGGFIGWARRSTFGSPAPAVLKAWDPMRVVDRFVEEQKIPSEAQVGEWSVDMLRTRVEALERHAEHRRVKEQQDVAIAVGPTPKKAKVSTPIKPSQPAAAPQSGVRRIFGWAMGSSISKKSSTAPPAIEAAAPVPVLESPAMSQVGSHIVFCTPSRPPTTKAAVAYPPTETSLSLPHPSSPQWRRTEPIPPAPPRPAPVTSLLSQSRPTPRTLSAILAASSTSSTMSSHDSLSSSSRLYPSLTPSMSQRSAAINALFTPGHSSSSTSKPVGVPIKRVSSVKDLVKSFEDYGVLNKSLEKENDLRRVQSRPV